MNCQSSTRYFLPPDESVCINRKEQFTSCFSVCVSRGGQPWCRYNSRPVIPQVDPATCPVPDLADTAVELPSSDKPWCESQAPGQTSARPAHLMDLLRFIALWAHEQRSGCPPVVSGIGCSAMVFLNKWLRQGGPVQIPSRYFLPAEFL